MTDSSPGYERNVEGESSSSSHFYPTATGNEDGGDNSRHQDVDTTLLEDDHLGDISQAQLVFS